MRSIVSLQLMALSLVACPDEPAPTTAASPPAVTTPDPVVDAVGTEPIVRVLDAGREPRSPLARDPIAREREVEIAIDMSSGEPRDAPGRMRFVARWTAAADRDMPGSFSVLRADMATPRGAPAGGEEKAIFAAIAAAYGQVEGHVRRRGPADLEFIQTKGLDTKPSVPWLLHLFSFAPPTDALGPGARWTTESNGDHDGMSCTDVRTYEIVAVAPQEITARIDAKLQCSASATERLPSAVYTMTGELRFDPADALATSGRITSRMDTTFPPFPDDPSHEPNTLAFTMELRLGPPTD
jgi:hypothetical protein